MESLCPHLQITFHLLYILASTSQDHEPRAIRAELPMVGQEVQRGPAGVSGKGPDPTMKDLRGTDLEGHR